MAAADPQDVRKEIAALLEADAELSITLKTHVYSSRQLPGSFNNELCVFTAGTSPDSSPVLSKGGGSPIYQFAIMWIVKFEAGGLAAAEDISDAIEQVVYRVLLEENFTHTLWRKVKFPQISLRPVAPGGTQNVHFGSTIVRMTPHP